MADDRTQDLRRSPSHQGINPDLNQQSLVYMQPPVYNVKGSGSRKPAPVVKPAPSTMCPLLQLALQVDLSKAMQRMVSCPASCELLGVITSSQDVVVQFRLGMLLDMAQ
ncbi:unnamed protein product [Polarella glacialis]|uniref:Uncharacterized protein n=1 Tax=Polarella glacialis TaxID=89957 RepID=A0A813ET10_POLGL|nr:unnamed protein product [Polarella glacialis]